jgi:hypothetical protein
MDEEFTDEVMALVSSAIVDLWSSEDEETRELLTRRKCWSVRQQED